MGEGEIKEKILQYRKIDGYSLNEISKIVSKSYNWVSKKDQELQEEGRLTEQDIKKAQEEKEIREFKTNPVVIRTLELKRKGMSDTEISKQDGINRTQPQISKYVRRAIELGMLKKDDIKKAQEERTEQSKEART